VIFVDTSFWVAVRNQRDANHVVAAKLLDQHGDSPLVTSNQVRGETWTFLRRRIGHVAAVGFLDALARSARVSLFNVDADAEERALAWLRRRGEREYSFVDATSFVTMKALRIDSALAFDGDFSAAGFVELRP
jgi:uncharacterized protein